MKLQYKTLQFFLYEKYSPRRTWGHFSSAPEGLLFSGLSEERIFPACPVCKRLLARGYGPWWPPDVIEDRALVSTEAFHLLLPDTQQMMKALWPKVSQKPYSLPSEWGAGIHYEGHFIGMLLDTEDKRKSCSSKGTQLPLCDRGLCVGWVFLSGVSKVFPGAYQVPLNGRTKQNHPRESSDESVHFTVPGPIVEYLLSLLSDSWIGRLRQSVHFKGFFQFQVAKTWFMLLKVWGIWQIVYLETTE